MRKNKQILITPLNWGLGHATRCIPIIKKLLRENNRVIIGSDGRALQLLREEFPKLPFVELPAYDIRYSGKNMVWSIGKQLPKIAKAVREEHKKVAALVAEKNITQIISDNRYGCYHPEVESIFITHQLNLLMPNKVLSVFANTINRFFIKKFDKIWVPDYEGKPNLSGKLSHGTSFGNVTFIGPQSRFEKIDVPIKYKAIVVLSGPEPQRSILEEKITSQALSLQEKILIVQGKTEGKTHQYLSETVEMISYLTSEELNKAISSAEVVISRSGYSTIMDLEKTGSKAVLIPTPGQTEQEYLAAYFSKNGIYKQQSQKTFSLSQAITDVI